MGDSLLSSWKFFEVLSVLVFSHVLGHFLQVGCGFKVER
jgi:hypothetical protein